jgi:hypothetical protein
MQQNAFRVTVLIIVGAFTLIWLSSRNPPSNPLLTGSSCVEIADRLMKHYEDHIMTDAEEDDMKRCAESASEP